jgi:hypothetical protein
MGVREHSSNTNLYENPSVLSGKETDIHPSLNVFGDDVILTAFFVMDFICHVLKSQN